jgi:hypothetical protein
VYTLPLHKNGSSYIVVCVFISTGTCLLPVPSNELFRLSGVMSQYHPLVNGAGEAYSEVLLIIYAKDNNNNNPTFYLHLNYIRVNLSPCLITKLVRP